MRAAAYTRVLMRKLYLPTSSFNRPAAYFGFNKISDLKSVFNKRS